MDQIFNNRYEIIEKIGTGGMANVYLATDNVLERKVAIKVLHEQYSSDNTFIDRFKHEAKSAANLNHPNVVNIYDWGQQDKYYYIVMEYIKGKNLKEILSLEGKLRWRDAAKVSSKVAAALTFAHRNDVVHRDIKPHNIIITSNNDVKVTDFGIAKAGVSTMTQTGTILGTAHYISPEQAQGKQADARSDIYSLGIVIYEMVSGKMPFDGENPIQIAMKHVSEAVPALKTSEVPQSFQNIIAKALAKSPEERYQTAEELREDLNNALAGADISAPLPSEDKTVILTPVKTPEPKHPPAKKTKKRKWPYFMLFLTLIALVVGVFAYNLINKPKVTIPNLRGMSSTSATKLLKERKLTMRIVNKEYSDVIIKDKIISQDPQSGTDVDEGTIISVIVSRGKEKFDVPNLIGQSKSNAEQTLENAGLVLGDITYRISKGPAGIVLSQDPDSGIKLIKGSAVNIVISKAIPLVSVPNIVGRSKKNSGVILNIAGLTASYIEQFNSSVKKGLVIDQSPNAGEKVKKGTSVTVYLSKGPKEQKKPKKPEVKMIKVPDVSGLDKTSASDKITGLGLTVTYNGEGEKVESQSPAAGTMVKEGSAVTLNLLGTVP